MNTFTYWYWRRRDASLKLYLREKRQENQGHGSLLRDSDALIEERVRVNTRDGCRVIPAPGADDAQIEEEPDHFEPEESERTLAVDQELLDDE